MPGRGRLRGPRVSDLSRAAVEAVDRDGMIGDVLDQPAQLIDALWRVESAAVPRREAAGGLVVCGMGGSAMGGDLAAAIVAGRARRPIRTVRDYELPPWISDDVLVLCSSYSGNTEETLACFEAAGARGAARVALTTGGALATAARKQEVPVIGVPAGFQPRAAVAYMTVAVLECAAACGAAPALRDEVERASARLTGLTSEWGPDGPDDSPPKAIARRLLERVPVIFGAGATAPVAVRWKNQLNENPEVAAFASTLPEADHNEICAWDGEAEALLAVLLEDPEAHPRVRRRFELTAEVLRDAERVLASGDSAAERVLSLVLLGDLASIYLAVLRGRDPTPVVVLERFKAALGSPG